MLGTLLRSETCDSGGGSFVVGDGVHPALAQDQQSSQLSANSSVTVNAQGTFDLNGQNETVASLTLAAGTVTTGTGILRSAGNVAVNDPGDLCLLDDQRFPRPGWPVPHNQRAGNLGESWPRDLSRRERHRSGNRHVRARKHVLVWRQYLRWRHGRLLGRLIRRECLRAGQYGGVHERLAGWRARYRSNASIGAEPLSIAGTGVSGNGALVSSGGTNSWAGLITLSAGPRPSA